MKKIYITLALLCSMNATFAQDLDSPEQRLAYADKLFERFEYVQAIEHYKKLVRGKKTDVHIYVQLAESYYNIFNSVEAAKWYAKAIEKNPEVDGETYFKYAQMLKASGRYEASNKAMKKFADLKPDDSRAVEFLKDPDYIPNLRSQEALFTFENLKGLNDEKFSDFAGILTHDDQFYFASTRTEKKKKYGWNSEPYLDVYVGTLDDLEYKIKDIKPVSQLNEKYHDGPVTITSDGNKMYFASESFREGLYEVDKEKRLKKGKVALFQATYNGKSWTKIRKLPFISGEYHVSNPSVSPDGTTLYFASDMPGGYGGMDIWKVAINEDGTFGEPVNMGDRINTEGRESFPFISETGKFYFASDAHKGFGGLDVYEIDLTAPGAKIKNLGDPINTPKDDFALSLYPTKGIGFLSTNRVGRDDIYVVKPVCLNEFVITVVNEKTGETLSDAKVAIIDHRGNVVETRTTDSRGVVTYDVDCDRTYSLRVDKVDYAGKSIELERTRDGKFPVSVGLRPIDLIVVNTRLEIDDIYFEFNRANITQEGAFELDKVVDIMRKNPSMKIRIESHTDTRGNDHYNLKLSQQRAAATFQYLVSKGIEAERMIAKGYGESQPKVDCGDNCTEEQHAINRRSEFIILER
ncbi:OmpA family protein [Capnocytophaga sp. ARDL2]|uniref:OmpA family protein n=1 Tax=Capnocytophaga sp. ARDL2 TaxID=3238809 RepID=UPI003557AC28